MKRVIYGVTTQEWQEDIAWRSKTNIPKPRYREYDDVDMVDLVFLCDEDTAIILKLRHPTAIITDDGINYGFPE